MSLAITFNVSGKVRSYKFSEEKMQELGIEAGFIISKLISKYPMMEVASIDNIEDTDINDDQLLAYLEGY